MLALIARNIIILPLLVASFLATATAQDSTTAQDGLSTSSAAPDSSPYPTAMIFLPGSLHDLPIDGRNLAASVITANLSQTAYAITCMRAASNNSSQAPPGCKLESTITVTGGESTLIYTYNPVVKTDNGMPGTSIPPSVTSFHSGATINCNMAGGTRATAATCTGSSDIEGLGRVGSSTTLASTQIDYATLTVTAGRQLLAQASEAAAKASSDGSAGEGSPGESAALSLKQISFVYGIFVWSAIIAAGVLAVRLL